MKALARRLARLEQSITLQDDPPTIRVIFTWAGDGEDVQEEREYPTRGKLKITHWERDEPDALQGL